MASPTATQVREWGRQQGHTVSNRGRLSHQLIAAFNRRRKPANQYTSPSGS